MLSHIGHGPYLLILKEQSAQLKRIAQKPKLNLRATLPGRVQRGNPDFSNGIFLPDPLIVSGWGVKFFPPPAFERF